MNEFAQWQPDGEAFQSLVLHIAKPLGHIQLVQVTWKPESRFEDFRANPQREPGALD